MIDLADLPVWATALGAKSSAVALLGLGTYLLGAPTIHLAHGHGEKAVADLGLRLALPFTLGAIGYAAGGDSCPQGSYFCIPAGVAFGAVGVLIGYVGAIAIDAAVIAGEDVDPPRSRVTKLRPFEWSPDIRSTRGGATAGIRGNF